MWRPMWRVACKELTTQTGALMNRKPKQQRTAWLHPYKETSTHTPFTQSSHLDTFISHTSRSFYALSVSTILVHEILFIISFSCARHINEAPAFILP